VSLVCVGEIFVGVLVSGVAMTGDVVALVVVLVGIIVSDGVVSVVEGLAGLIVIAGVVVAAFVEAIAFVPK